MLFGIGKPVGEWHFGSYPILVASTGCQIASFLEQLPQTNNNNKNNRSNKSKGTMQLRITDHLTTTSAIAVAVALSIAAHFVHMFHVLIRC
eukprot:m.325969 g.325969  ORF g.325969 m.325969 type:complete len:91 (+) comp16016_c0_seq8:6638-6910(+)